MYKYRNLHCFIGPQSLIGGTDLSRRPFDSELASVTLWPEIEKVFGHGYEVMTLMPLKRVRHLNTIFDSQSRWAFLIHEDSLPQPVNQRMRNTP